MDRSVKSATRVFDLLEAFERQRRPLRVADLVESLDAPQSSVSMLLKTLVSQGYLDCNPTTREYCPSARIANMCEWVTHLPNRPQAIPEAMHKLAEQTGETILPGYDGRLGGHKVKDINGDGTISAADQVIVGNPNPDVIFGFATNLSYQGFDLSTFL